MTETPTIQAALAAVMADVRKVAKSGTNTAQHFNFRGIDAVLNAVGPALRDHAVVIRPEVTDLRYERVVVGDRKAAVQVLAFVTYEFVGPAGDSLATKVVGEAIDYGDKGVSKAMSVALRTALIQTLALPTGDPEPDAQRYERARDESPPPRQRAPRQSAYSRGSDADRPAGDTDTLTAAQNKTIHTLLSKLGIKDRDAKLLGYAHITGRIVETTGDLTKGEASQIIEDLKARFDNGQADDVDPTLDPEWKGE